MSKFEEVVLVDSQDNIIGYMEKIEAHKKALLHRAISVFIFNTKGEWLLQKRSNSKYHSPNLWTNTCCTHPLKGESYINASNRRLKFEMGLEAKLIDVHNFIYNEKLDNELTEHELDHVFVGITNTAPKINLDEVSEWKYINTKMLFDDISINPQNYTIWFKQIVETINNIVNHDERFKKLFCK
jgi:isopentenyl-diphosphate delta-isomerase